MIKNIFRTVCLIVFLILLLTSVSMAENNNHLQVLPEGSSENTIHIVVDPGGNVTMKVVVTADDTDGITYQWEKLIYREEDAEWQIITDAQSDTYADSVHKNTLFLCRVTDRFGNQEFAWFYIDIENHLKAWADGESQDTQEKHLVSSLAEPLTMKINTSADDESGITYRWQEDKTNDWQEIDDAKDNTLTISVTANTNFLCSAYDKYGNERKVLFYVSVDNHLQIMPEGSSEKTIHIAVSPGENTNMKAIVTADDTDGITYQWEKLLYTEENADWQIITEAKSNTWGESVQKNTLFVCRVTDRFGNQEFAWFYIDIDNHLKAWPEGEVNENSNIRITVSPNETVTMKVNIFADDPSGITYQWSRNENEMWELIPDAVSDTLNESVSIATTYICSVTDRYGNNQNVFFEISIDNQLKAIQANGVFSIPVLYGNQTTLEVVASCAKGKLNYQWYKRAVDQYDEEILAGATNANITTESITEPCYYICKVSDQYSNQTSVSFYIIIDNKLRLSLSEHDLFVSYGETASIEAFATCLNGPLEYTWRLDGTTDPSVNGPIYTISNITTSHSISCTIKDQYGNTLTTGTTNIYINNHLSTNISARVNNSPVTTLKEKNDFGETEYHITVRPGEKLEITCNADCDDGDVQYDWSDWGTGNPLEINENTITISNTISTCIFCSVKDQYENIDWFLIRIEVDNGLKAEPATPVLQLVSEGSDVILGVNATATNDTPSYTWYKNDTRIHEDASDDTETLNTVAEAGHTIYRCRISDEFNNYTDIVFDVMTTTPQQLITNQEKTISFNSWNSTREIYTFVPTQSGIYTLSGYNKNYRVTASVSSIVGEINYDYDETTQNFSLAADLSAGTQYIYYIESNGFHTFSMKLTKGSPDPTIDLNHCYVLRPGQTARLPVAEIVSAFSSNPNVISINDTTIIAGQTGSSRLTVTTSDGKTKRYDFNVQDGTVMTVPKDLSEIEAEAFSGDTALRFLILNNTIKTIGAYAFDDSGLLQISVPAADTKIPYYAFGNVRPTILCQENSKASIMAEEYSHLYLYIK